MKILDLFAGTGGWTQAADPTDSIVSIELSARFSATHHLDIGDVQGVIHALGGWRPDLILASPPCNSFSTGSMGRMWTHDGEPKHPIAVEGKRLVLATRRIIERLEPTAFVIENPSARLRTLDLLDGIPMISTTYCHLGVARMKSTTLWTMGLPDIVLPPKCHNRPGKNRLPHPDDCCCKDHVSAQGEPHRHPGWREHRRGGSHPIRAEPTRHRVHRA